MDLSRKTDYALRMLASLVRNPGSVVSVRTAAREGGVPYSFARSIQHDLGASGLVENSRGATGGMRLAVDPREVTLLDLIEAVQGPVAISGCMGTDGRTPCANVGSCHFAPIWSTAENLQRAFFSSVTLHQIVVEGLAPVFDGRIRLVSEAEARERCRTEGVAVGAAYGGSPCRCLQEARAAGEKDAGEKNAPGEKAAPAGRPPATGAEAAPGAADA